MGQKTRYPAADDLFRVSLVIAILFMMVCTGCGKLSPKETVPPEPQTETRHEVSRNPTIAQATVALEEENPESYAQLLEMSTFIGDVTEFWETGCKLTPIHYEENIAYSAAPGYETEWITAAYQDTCTFWFATVNLQTGAVFYEEASVQSIKEQQSLLICGEYDGSNVLQAKSVFICRFVN